jgi:hypothetical protein
MSITVFIFNIETYVRNRYLSTALLRSIFMFKCRLPLLRLVPALHLLALPPLLYALEAYHQRLPRSPNFLTSPSISAVTLAAFPPLWFFGFLYYTDVPGVAFVLASFVMQANGQNWLAAMVRDSLCLLSMMTDRGVITDWPVEFILSPN